VNSFSGEFILTALGREGVRQLLAEEEVQSHIGTTLFHELIILDQIQNAVEAAQQDPNRPHSILPIAEHMLAKNSLWTFPVSFPTAMFLEQYIPGTSENTE
jgi:hypothetical protein